TVTLTVTDASGAASTPVTTTATIANAVPSVTLPANQAATAGSAYALSASFGDAGVNDAPWAYAIDWGDGSPQTSGSASSQSAAITASHTYAAGGTDTVRVTVTDKDGGAGSAKTPVTVAAVNHPPTAVAGGANAGSPVTLSATFSDPGANDAPWAYTINWGDGSAATTGSASSQATGISASHTYAAAGTNTATVTVTDKDGAAGSGQTIVTVSPPSTSATALLAGNIARCDRTNDEATAAILDTTQGTVFALGDNAYPNGTAANFQNCYDPTWGRHKARPYPLLGNHEYD